jgi:predicted metal-binding protein
MGKQLAMLIACTLKNEYKPESIKTSNNTAIHWKFQDAILARLLNRVGWDLKAEIDGVFLSSGYCMGCPGKKCTFKMGDQSCRNPNRRTYSLEATGINVVSTVKSALGLDLYWYTRDRKDIPYMLKCIAFFPETNKHQTDLIASLEKVLRALPNIEVL